MAENFVNILREIRGKTLAPATDKNCIYGDIKWMYGVISGYRQITPEERLKLENIEEEATKNSSDQFLLSRENHTGTINMDHIADSSSRFAMTIDDRNKIDSAVLGGTKNDTDANLRERSTHTGVQSADTIVDGVTNAAFTNLEKVKLEALDTTKPPVHSHDNETISSLSYSKLIDVPASFTPSKHLHDMNEITLGNLDASRITESSDKQFVTSAQKGRISGSEQAVNRGVPNGYAPLDGNGKINPSYLESLNLVNVFTPVDFDAMLLLSSATPGDIAYVQDSEEAYMLVGLPSDDRLNWKELNSDVGVISINGLTGAVSISSDDLPEGSVNKYFTEVRETEIKESIEEVENRLDIFETAISNANLTRADKYLASQNVVKMLYSLKGKLSKVRYNNDTDVDYEVLTYNLEGKLINVAHYVESVLRGNTTLSYENGKLVASPYTAV